MSTAAQHFRYLDVFAEVLHGKLNEGASVLTYDPLDTALPATL